MQIGHVKGLGMGRLSWIIRVGPRCNHMVLVRGKQALRVRDRDAKDRREGQERLEEAVTGGFEGTERDCRRRNEGDLLEAAKASQQISPLKPPERVQPHRHLDLGTAMPTLTSGIVRK